MTQRLVDTDLVQSEQEICRYIQKVCSPTHQMYKLSARMKLVISEECYLLEYKVMWYFQRKTRRYIVEDCAHPNGICENLESY